MLLTAGRLRLQSTKDFRSTTLPDRVLAMIGQSFIVGISDYVVLLLRLISIGTFVSAGHRAWLEVGSEARFSHERRVVR